MSDVTFYGNRLSPFVEKVCRAAAYKQVPHTLQDLGFTELAKASPVTRKIPVMKIGKETVYDSTFILRRLDALKPDPPLLDADPEVAAAQRLLEDWSDESLYWQVMALRWCDENAARTVAQMSPFLPAPLRPFARPLLKRVIGSSTRAQGLGRLPYDVLLREIGNNLDDLVSLLGKRAFFYAERPSAADFALFGELNTGCSDATPDFARLVSERPALSDWRKRVADASGG
ncbi:MAG: glutathione S-transferase family protein [Myxococcota bacterium]